MLILLLALCYLTTLAVFVTGVMQDPAPSTSQVLPELPANAHYKFHANQCALLHTWSSSDKAWQPYQYT